MLLDLAFIRPRRHTGMRRDRAHHARRVIERLIAGLQGLRGDEGA
jgi:hypothetical protein